MQYPLNIDNIKIDSVEIDSIHNIYNDLNTIKTSIGELEYNIDHIFFCCSCYNTILSYSLTKKANIYLIKQLLDNGANIQLELELKLENSYTPLYYLFMYQDLSIITIIMNYANIKIVKIFQLLELCISNNELSKTAFIINNDFSILFSNELKNIITKYDKLEWYRLLGNNIFILLHQANI